MKYNLLRDQEYKNWLAEIKTKVRQAQLKAAVKVNKLGDLKSALEGLLSDPMKFDGMKESIKSIRKPDAAYDVAKFVYGL